MKKLKKYFKKILNYNFKKTVKTNRNKMFFSNYKKNTFKKRKKQLSLNINNFNHITHILKNKYFWYL